MPALASRLPAPPFPHNAFISRFQLLIRIGARGLGDKSLRLTNTFCIILQLACNFPRGGRSGIVSTVHTENLLCVCCTYFCIPQYMTLKGLLLSSNPLDRIVSYCSKSFSSAIMATYNPSASEPVAEKPWHAVYPAPKTTAAVITRESLLTWMLEGKVAGKDFVLVDLRRTDFEVRPSVLLKT